MVFAFLRLFLGASHALAQATLVVDIGTPLSWAQITQSIVNFLAGGIGAISSAVFIYGALKMTGSGFNEEWRNQGKDLMIKSLVALALTLGAYAILRTVTYALGV